MDILIWRQKTSELGSKEKIQGGKTRWMDFSQTRFESKLHIFKSGSNFSNKPEIYKNGMENKWHTPATAMIILILESFADFDEMDYENVQVTLAFIVNSENVAAVRNSKRNLIKILTVDSEDGVRNVKNKFDKNLVSLQIIRKELRKFINQNQRREMEIRIN